MSNEQNQDSVVLKVRVVSDEGNPPFRWAVASVWMGQRHVVDISTLRIDHVEGPNDPNYRGWVNACAEIMRARMKKIQARAIASLGESVGGADDVPQFEDPRANARGAGAEESGQAEADPI